MIWLCLGLAALVPIVCAVYLLRWHLTIIRLYLPYVARIFQEKPLFVVPFGKPTPEAEDVVLQTTHGLSLRGCYLPAHGPRKGVILFGLEFGTNRWSCRIYCDFLRDQGYDIFTFEMRGQGESAAQPGYEPLQWVTEYEVQDFEAALAYLKTRADADARGIGFFGLSKGAGAGVAAAARNGQVRCLVTDGMFGAYSTMVPYMRKWIYIYVKNSRLAGWLPNWYYRHIAALGLRKIEAESGCEFHMLEQDLKSMAPRPLLMIHGGADNYIKPEMAQDLFNMARQPKELWIVEGAKHNQAIHHVTHEYHQRVLAFFDQHLAGGDAPAPQKNRELPGSTQPAGVTTEAASSSDAKTKVQSC